MPKQLVAKQRAQLADKVSKLRQTAEKAGIFFVLVFVGVLGTPEYENGKSKRHKEYLDDIPCARKNFKSK